VLEWVKQSFNIIAEKYQEYCQKYLLGILDIRIELLVNKVI